MVLSKSLFICLLIGLLASFTLAQFDEGGCDGFGSEFDLCGVCGGNNECLKQKQKEGEGSNTVDERDLVNGCDGLGGQYDECGECNGENACVGCDGELWSGRTYSACGVCGGSDSACPRGCDGHGGVYDGCGVCNGDNSTCSCVKYHGFKTPDMNYMLFQYLIDQTLWKIQGIMDTLILTMEDLEEYSGPADLGVMIQYLNDFCEECLSEYSLNLDEFTYSVKQSIGLIDDLTPFNRSNPYEIQYQ